jgi:hypothetical protein
VKKRAEVTRSEIWAAGSGRVHWLIQDAPEVVMIADLPILVESVAAPASHASPWMTAETETSTTGSERVLCPHFHSKTGPAQGLETAAVPGPTMVSEPILSGLVDSRPPPGARAARKVRVPLVANSPTNRSAQSAQTVPQPQLRRICNGVIACVLMRLSRPQQLPGTVVRLLARPPDNRQFQDLHNGPS